MMILQGDGTKYDVLAVYGTSKLLNVLFTIKMQQLLENDGYIITTPWSSKTNVKKECW